MLKEFKDKVDPLLYFWMEQRRHYRLAEKHLRDLEKESAAYMLDGDVDLQVMCVQMEMVKLSIEIVRILNTLQEKYPRRFPKDFNAEKFWNAKA